jgi:hypothetical protein
MSANEKHDLQTNDKAIPGIGVVQLYLGMPSNEELQVMIPKMTDDPVNVVLERAELVGNLPRYILKQSVCEKCNYKMEEAISSIHNAKGRS